MTIKKAYDELEIEDILSEIARIGYIRFKIDHNKQIIDFNKYFNYKINKLRDSNIITDYNFALEVLSLNGDMYKYCSLELRDNEILSILAIKYNGYNIRYASDRIKNIDDIVYIALNNQGLALKYCLDKYKNDERAIELAINNNPLAIEYCYTNINNEIMGIIDKVKTYY